MRWPPVLLPSLSIDIPFCGVTVVGIRSCTLVARGEEMAASSGFSSSSSSVSVSYCSQHERIFSSSDMVFSHPIWPYSQAEPGSSDRGLFVVIHYTLGALLWCAVTWWLHAFASSRDDDAKKQCSQLLLHHVRCTGVCGGNGEVATRYLPERQTAHLDFCLRLALGRRL